MAGLHVFDMIKRLKENENLKQLEYFKSQGTHAGVPPARLVDGKTSTPEELKVIREAVAAGQKKERRRMILILVLSFITVACLLLVAGWLM